MAYVNTQDAQVFNLQASLINKEIEVAVLKEQLQALSSKVQFVEPESDEERNPIMTKKLQELKDVQKDYETQKLILEAKRVLEKYYLENNSHEKREDAKRQFYAYNRQLCTFATDLRDNIQNIEENKEIRVEDLLNVPLCPKSFEIETEALSMRNLNPVLENRYQELSSLLELVKKQNLRKEAMKTFKRYDEKQRHSKTRDAVLRSFYLFNEKVINYEKELSDTVVKISLNRKLRMEDIIKLSIAPQPFKITSNPAKPIEYDPELLQKLQCLQKDVEQQNLVEKAEELLETYLITDVTQKSRIDAMEQYKDYKYNYHEFMYILKANIYKIEQNASSSVLLAIPEVPQPFKVTNEDNICT